MEVLSENIRRRPYLSRKAKSKQAPKQSFQKPKKKKRSTCDDIDTNTRKRRKRNTKVTAPAGHRMMTRARSTEPTPVAIFDEASQAAKKDSPEAVSIGNDAGNKSPAATSTDSADAQAKTPDAVEVSESPGHEQQNIPQGVRPYDDRVPLLADGYAHDIHEYYFKRECEFRPDIKEIKAVQTEITAKMRSILLDWLVEVAQEFHLNDDTLFLCIDFIDRAISVMLVKKSRLQLLGCACLLIASKYEEIHPPTVEELAYISDDTYTSEQIRKMEKEVLRILSFELSVPTARTFLSRFVRCASSDKKERILCAYLAELCLLDINWLGRKPSLLAASVLFLARKTLKSLDDPAPVWDATMEHYTHYRKEQIKAGVMAVHKQHVAMYGNNKLIAIKDKYSSAKKCCVTSIKPLQNFDMV